MKGQLRIEGLQKFNNSHLSKYGSTLFTALVAVIFFGWVMAFSQPVSAQQLGDRPNNSVGVHVISPSDDDMRRACRLVNANGGRWGYVTIPLREGEYNHEGLQRLNDILREEECIPIWRLATTFDGPVWKKFTNISTKYWVDLWKNITPTTQKIHIILGNEVNHGQEYGGTCDPADYGVWADKAARDLKQSNPDFFIMLAGLDLAAPEQRPNFCDAGAFYRDMLAAAPSVYDHVGGLAAHCYPRDFVGGVEGGRRSVFCYQWEKEHLTSLGVAKAASLPVFITETGWKVGPGYVSEQFAASQMAQAWSGWQADSQVEAVTPFAFKFCGEPFIPFSMIDCRTEAPNGIYDTLFALDKHQGDPQHTHKAVSLAYLGKELVQNQDHTYEIRMTNKGTDIWKNSGGNYSLTIIGGDEYGYKFESFGAVKPKDTLTAELTFNPKKASGCPTIRFGMKKNNDIVMKLFDWQPCIFEMPQLSIEKMKKFPGFVVGSADGELQIFRESDEQLVFRKKVTITSGDAAIGDISGVNFDESYRLVWISPSEDVSYLPVQVTGFRFTKEDNAVQMPVLLPFDRNNDGQLSFGDMRL